MLRYVSDVTAAALQEALSGQTTRQRAVANNLANVDTPGFHPTRVAFEDELRAALGRDAPADEVITRVDSLRPREQTHAGPGLRRDGNAVDLESEMVTLAESQLHAAALVKLLAHKLRMIRSVATEGGK
jgi:flagellar basal-body rod protein FlgB